MADLESLVADEAPGKKAMPTDENPRVAAEELDHAEVMKRWEAAWLRERDNIDLAYEDLRFYAGEQWPEELRQQREYDSRPVLTFNRMGQFVRQITGDIRQMRPAIKVVAADDGADEKIAEIRGGMIRHIENRSDAEKAIYPLAADSQVQCGIGHWEVFSEYADDSTFEQELGLRLIDDQVAVLWDPDAKHPTRKDAIYCFSQVDLTRDAYKATYPDYAVSDIGTPQGYTGEWYKDDRIRIARYWYKVKTTRRLMAMPNSGYEDLEGASQEDIFRMQMEGGQIVERNGHKIRWVMMNGTEFLGESQDWPGRYIPIVPVIGEEVRIGARIYRHGVVRFAADAQRAYNYARSTQTEFVGLQPKAPYLGTEENFKDYENEWSTANVKNWPFLRYKPDPRNGGASPARSQPPVGSSGLTECVIMAEQDMQAVIGIYNAQIGARSNETSGIAISRREKQGDTGTYVYMTNFSTSIVHTARILNDLIPHFYDTPRTVRIVEVDGNERREKINTPQGVSIDGIPIDVLNDVTTGAYDVVMEMGPSYATKREEARDGMTAFVQAFPPAGPLIADLVAKAQDWPNADEVADRLFHVLPPSLQAEIAEKSGDPSKMPKPAPPDPMQQAQAEAVMAKAGAEKARAQSEVGKAEFEMQNNALKLRQQELANVKAEFDVLDAQMKLAANGMPLDPNWHRNVDQALKVLDHAVSAQMTDAEAATPVAPAGVSEAGQEPMPQGNPPVPPGAGSIPPLPAPPGAGTAPQEGAQL